MSLNVIAPSRFYGNSLNGFFDAHEARFEENKRKIPFISDRKPKSILEPSYYSKEFWKQSEALTDAAENSRDSDILCCFVFQGEEGKRRFVVTYPEDFWSDTETLPKERRAFYEVIPENSPCFLYYDLEFETDLNKDKNGINMTKTILDITCAYIKKHWNYTCDEKIVINLDSSRTGKFSKHLIFSTKDAAFENNSHIGYLVKMICADIVNFLVNGADNEILSKFKKEDLQELFVETEKGKKLFIDTNVYTKNRHFRVYTATKWGKNSHLVRASDCKYIWKEPGMKEVEFFKKSLITYLPRQNKMELFSFDQDKKAQMQTFSQFTKNCMVKSFICKEYPKSPYPFLDKYISEFVKPGKIRDSKFNEKQKAILYEIVGNRYCENIGRWHKSNNIYFIVDLIGKDIFQKCHDEDCATFISTPKKLPPGVTFYFEDEVDSLLMDL